MARRKKTAEPLGTIWEVSDELWELIEPVLLELDPPHKGHRPRIDPRAALDGIIYHLRTGCQWNALPERFGDDTSVHRTMQRWVRLGVFDRIWAMLVEACDELGAVQWAWQSYDCALGAITTATGPPSPSVSTPRFVPFFARSVGFGPT